MAELFLSECTADELATLVSARVADAVRVAMSEASHPPLVDRHQMAALLGISLPKLDRLVAADEVPSILVGTRRLFEARRVVDALADRNREDGDD